MRRYRHVGQFWATALSII